MKNNKETYLKVITSLIGVIVLLILFIYAQITY